MVSPRGLDAQVETPTPSRVWGDQWLRVSEKVLTGLNHQLTNRSAALDSLVGVMAGESDPDHGMITALQEEIVRLIDLLKLYRLLPAESSPDAQAMRLQDTLPQVLRLHMHHADLRGVTVALDGDENTDPVLIRPSALMRSLLVLLESGAGNAARSGRKAPLTLGYGPDGERFVRITLEGTAPVGQMVFTGPGSLVHAVRNALAHANGTVDATIVDGPQGPLLRYVLRFPTLTEARRLEDDTAA
ncbi:MAG TPA: hypothetical protein VJ717_17400 [Gemmatimonadaceae bacterium]|nr:hypothetical protein [Gemmatimonadaceae bacterium]